MINSFQLHLLYIPLFCTQFYSVNWTCVIIVNGNKQDEIMRTTIGKTFPLTEINKIIIYRKTVTKYDCIVYFKN